MPTRAQAASPRSRTLTALLAVAGASGDHAAGAEAFGPSIRHILDTADMISGGIIRRFPAKFE